MVIKVEILNDVVLDLLHNLEKLSLIKLDDTLTSLKSRQLNQSKQLTDAELFAKIKEGEASTSVYQFKGNELSKLGDMLLDGQAVERDNYKMTSQ
jgi:hypothetical protein